MSDRERARGAPEQDVDPREELAAAVAEFVLAGRHDRLEQAYLGAQGPAAATAVGRARETLAAVAAALAPEAPPTPLRDRIMATLAAKAAAAKQKRSALLVVDMIRDHLEPGKPLEVPRAREIVGALSKRLDDARAAGVPVVYVVDEHDPDDSDLESWGAHAVKGSTGVEVWPALAPKPGDRVVNKPSYSAFFDTNLGAVLDELRVDSLVLTGCLTEIGLMATATDALQRGFDVEVPPDSQAGSSAEMEVASLAAMTVMTPYGPARKKRLEHLAQLGA
jgi:nicotinamidase-related amidase